MSALSRKIRKVEGGYSHWCPACNDMHFFRERVPFATLHTWTYDQNHEHPTFDPSMNISHPPEASVEPDAVPAYRCHYRLISGYLHYCSDCTHSYKNQVVELPDLPLSLQ